MPRRRKCTHTPTITVNPSSTLGIRLTVTPGVSNEVVARVQAELLKLQGVHYVSASSSGFEIGVANDLFDKCEIALAAEELVRAIICNEPAPPACIRVKVQSVPHRANTWKITTSYRHTDSELLKKLTAACSGPFKSAEFEAGGYNIQVKTTEKSCNRIRNRAQKVIDAFYSDDECTEPFKIKRYARHESIDSFLCVATNHRFSKEESNELKEQLEEQVPGVYNAHSDNGGYNWQFIMANDLFDRDDAAAAVIEILTDYIAVNYC